MSECSQCGECCRWFVVARKKGLKPWQLVYLRERCDKETDEYFLLDAPCKHLKEVTYKKEFGQYSVRGPKKFECNIYDRRPQICKDYCGKRYSNGQIYYVPEQCNLSTGKKKS